MGIIIPPFSPFGTYFLSRFPVPETINHPAQEMDEKSFKMTPPLTREKDCERRRLTD
jgi:hypothetical protein